MELCDGGDLQQALKQRSSQPLPEAEVWHIFLQILLGVAYLHSKRTLHRDLKTANVFLVRPPQQQAQAQAQAQQQEALQGSAGGAAGSTGASSSSSSSSSNGPQSLSSLRVKIGDLGVARVLGSETAFAKTCVGTPYYLSPELCQDQPYNERSDVWALGVMLYELLTGKHPFDAKNQGAPILKIISGAYPPISAELYSMELRLLVEALQSWQLCRQRSRASGRSCSRQRATGGGELWAALAVEGSLLPAAAALLCLPGLLPLAQRPCPCPCLCSL
jgi:NIMA (never in mitosis gene a)-related kinase